VAAAAIFLVGTPPSYGFSSSENHSPGVGGAPLSCLELLGRSALHRMARRFVLGGINDFTLLADSAVLSAASLQADSEVYVKPHVLRRESDQSAELQSVITTLLSRGLDHVFLVWLGHYVEFDPEDVIEYSRDQRLELVRLCDQAGPLGVWLVNGDSAKKKGDSTTGKFCWPPQDARNAKPLPVEGYVNRLGGTHDLRRFVKDMFASSCEARPCGREIKPGIWVDEGADLHRQARIIPPAYIGAGTTIAAATLITRGSSVERDCMVNCGTVIEDSSILAGTYVGTGLDISHSVIYGKNLIHLQRDLEMEIYDEMLIATNSPSRLRHAFRRPALQLVKHPATRTKSTHLKGAL